jgi:ABC-2 type transport system permease protein
VIEPADAELKAALTAVAPDDTELEFTTYVDRRAAEAALEGDLHVVLIGRSELVWADAPDADVETLASLAVTQLEVRERARDAGLTTDEATALFSPVELASTSLSGAVTDDAATRETRLLIAQVGMVLLLASLAFYGNSILMSVIEEKQNRVVEVLLAHVDPRDLLAGKVLGHGAVGLAQIAAIALVAVAGLALTDPIEMPANTFVTVAGMVGWFVLGFAFYSILYGALGSLASQTDDANSAVGPLNFVLIGAFWLGMMALDDPTGSVALVGSFLPPTAPLVMPARAALADVATWEILLAVLIELAAILALVRLGGRLYRGSVLHIGRKLAIREAWNATR